LSVGGADLTYHAFQWERYVTPNIASVAQTAVSAADTNETLPLMIRFAFLTAVVMKVPSSEM